MTETEIQAETRKSLSDHLGGDVDVAGFTRLSGGASCEVHAFRARFPGEPEPRDLVLRLDGIAGNLEGDRDEEFAILQAAARAGVRVPEVFVRGRLSDGSKRRYFIMERVGGLALARKLLRDSEFAAARRNLPSQLAHELSQIHQVDLADPSITFLAKPKNPSGPNRYALAEIDRYGEMLAFVAAGRAYPLLALAERWLRGSPPPVDNPSLVHGDFRIGNIMFDPTGLVAVLDWELAHQGDPMEDLGWFCVRAWRFGADQNPAGGLCSREDFWGHYEEHSGRTVKPEHALYWELFGNWKWAIICLWQAERHKGGPYPDLELATIGRRVAETQAEILSLMEEIAHA